MPGNPNPSPKTRIKKGQRLPGSGRKPIINRELIKYTAEEVAKCIMKLQALTTPEIHKISRSEVCTVLERMIARGMYKDTQTGSLYNFEKLLIRSIGTPTIKQELSGPSGVALVPPTVIFEASVKKE